MPKWTFSKWVGFWMLAAIFVLIFTAAVLQHGLPYTLVAFGSMAFVWTAIILFFS